MEKIQANICFDVVFLYTNIRTCLFTHVFLYFHQLVPPLHHNGKGSIKHLRPTAHLPFPVDNQLANYLSTVLLCQE